MPRSSWTCWSTRLRPGALLIVTVPALPWLWSAWDAQHGHHRRYDKDALCAALTRAGFQVLRCRHLFQSMVLPALLRRSRPAGGPEFPRLPRALDALLYRLCRFEATCLGWLPFGTSLAVVARR